MDMLRNMATSRGPQDVPAVDKLSTNVHPADLSKSAEWYATLWFVASESKSERARVPLSRPRQHRSRRQSWPNHVAKFACFLR